MFYRDFLCFQTEIYDYTEHIVDLRCIVSFFCTKVLFLTMRCKLCEINLWRIEQKGVVDVSEIVPGCYKWYTTGNSYCFIFCCLFSPISLTYHKVPPFDFLHHICDLFPQCEGKSHLPWKPINLTRIITKQQFLKRNIEFRWAYLGAIITNCRKWFCKSLDF